MKREVGLELMSPNLCFCSSNPTRRPVRDARGIFCTYVCDTCETEKLARFKLEIFTDPDYDAPDLGDDDYEELS
jgi:hypothetical protein